MTSERVNYDTYKDYLKSDKWKSVKVDYAEHEETDECVCCGVPFKFANTASNYHHYKYPRDWNDDSWENLIIVCRNCHKVLHEELDHNSDSTTLRDYIKWLNSVFSERLSGGA